MADQTFQEKKNDFHGREKRHQVPTKYQVVSSVCILLDPAYFLGDCHFVLLVAYYLIIFKSARITLPEKKRSDLVAFLPRYDRQSADEPES